MDEEMKNAEQAANEVKNEGGSIFDELKGMLNEATQGEGNVFDKLKGIFEGKEGDPSIFEKAKEMFDGKEGEPGMLDQLKEMLDKGTTAAGEISQDFLDKAKEMFDAKEGEPSLLDKAKEMFGEGAAAAGEMMDKAKAKVGIETCDIRISSRSSGNNTALVSASVKSEEDLDILSASMSEQCRSKGYTFIRGVE